MQNGNKRKTAFYCYLEIGIVTEENNAAEQNAIPKLDSVSFWRFKQ